MFVVCSDEVKRFFLINKHFFILMNIFVSGLNYSMSSDELNEIFAQYGSVVSAKVVEDRATGRSRGFGFVEMAVDDEARNAISALDQAEVKGRKINVKEAEDRPQRSSGGGGGSDRPRGGGNYGGGGGGGRREGGYKPRFNRDGDGGGGYDRGNRY